MASNTDVPADLEAFKNMFVGEWTLTKSEGLDEYLKFIGLNFVFRKVAKAASCTLIISVDEGGKIRFITKGPKTQDHSFFLNTDIDDTDPVGNEMTARVTFEDGKMVTNSSPKGKSNAKVTKVTREVITGVDGKPEKMVMTVNAGTLEMKRFFDKKQ